MANNPKKPGASAGNTFLAAEVDALRQLFKVLDLKGDPKLILRSPEITGVRRKFETMHASINRQKASGTT